MWCSERTEEDFSKGDGCGRLQGFPEKLAMERLYAKDLEREKCRGSDHWCAQPGKRKYKACTFQLVIYAFQKAVILNHFPCEYASDIIGLLFPKGCIIMHGI